MTRVPYTCVAFVSCGKLVIKGRKVSYLFIKLLRLTVV